MVKELIKISSIIGFAIALFISFSSFAAAHPGNTASDGMHYCYTNCSYWGEVYGQRHGHGGSSRSSYSYTTPTYASTIVSSNADCTSNGFAYLGSCYELPDNAKKSYFSGFTCDYGYEEVGYGLSKKCLAEVDNGYRIGTSIFCDYG